MKSVVLILSMLAVAVSVEAAEVLESRLLKLEVVDKPYGYTLTEKSTGKVVVENQGAIFGDSPVEEAELKLTDKNLIAEIAGKGSIRFSFRNDHVLTVTIKGGRGETFKDNGECYYGVHGSDVEPGIDNRGRDVEMIGRINKRFGGIRANARAPIYVTDHGYSIYAETMAQGWFRFAKEGSTTFTFNTEELTYHIMYGPTYAEIMQQFNEIAGPAILPPDWAFGTIWWRDDTNQKKVEKDLDDLRRLKIHSTAHWIDRPFTSGGWGWGNMDFGKERFPNVDGMMNKLKDNNSELIVWIANRSYGELRDLPAQKGWFFEGFEKKKTPAVDMRIPEAYEWYKEKLSFFPRFGVKGYKIDRGAENSMPDYVQNENMYLYSKMSVEGMRDVHGDDYLIFARNFFDKARQYIGYWNGDTYGDWTGLQSSLQGALRCAAMNISTFGSDTGGYYGKKVSNHYELNIRWLQFSTYSTMCQVLLDNYDISLEADHPVLQVMREQMNRHHDMIPYSRSCTYHNTRTGMTVMRPMAFEFPDDERLEGLWEQFMYGPNLLIAPVVESGQSTKKVVLPAGNWMLIHGGGKVYEGPAEVEVPAPNSFIPVFMREGAIIPYGDVVKGNNNWTENWSPTLRIEVYPGKTESSFDYYNRKEVLPIKCVSGKEIFSVKFDDPGLPGEVVVYCGKPGKVVLNGRKLAVGKEYMYSGIKLTVPFKGKVDLEVGGADMLSPETTKLEIPEALDVEAYKPPVTRSEKPGPVEGAFNIIPLDKGVRVYIDRDVVLDSVPIFLKGASLIQTERGSPEIGPVVKI